MKVKEAISRADALRPNTIDADQKALWLMQYDSEIAEMMNWQISDREWVENDYELLMPFPKDEIYVLFLMAKIDFANEEMQLYANDAAAANGALAEAKAWYRRNFPAPKAKRIKWW